MTWPELVILGVVLLVGVPASFRNPTAAALVASWAFGQGVWLATGDNLPLRAYVMTDIAVLVVVACKPLKFRGPYTSIRRQFRGVFIERSAWDRIVIAIFPVMWALYVLTVGDKFKWYALWALAIIQILAAGGEALQSWLAARKANAGQAAATDDVVYRSALASDYG